MDNANEQVVRRLDALLGLALTRFGRNEERTLSENVRYLRNLEFSTMEIAAILGKSLHHIEVEASKLARQGKVKRHRGKR